MGGGGDIFKEAKRILECKLVNRTAMDGNLH